jgi:hypothetical protein
MKKPIYTLALIVLASITNIMAQELPKDGAIISIENPVINLNAGLEFESTVKLIRSKRHKDADFGGLMARTPQGLNIKFTEDSENKDTFKMIVSADENLELKAYTVIVKGEGMNAQKVRGITLTINMSANQVVTTN